jgi:hypothetical protein
MRLSTGPDVAVTSGRTRYRTPVTTDYHPLEAAYPPNRRGPHTSAAPRAPQPPARATGTARMRRHAPLAPAQRDSRDTATRDSVHRSHVTTGAETKVLTAPASYAVPIR